MPRLMPSFGLPPVPGATKPHNAPPPPPPPPPPAAARRGGAAESMSSVAARLAAACQSTLLGRTLQQFGGIVQVITEASAPYRVLSVSQV